MKNPGYVQQKNRLIRMQLVPTLECLISNSLSSLSNLGPYLQKRLHKTLGQLRGFVLLRSEVFENMRELFPVVHCLLYDPVPVSIRPGMSLKAPFHASCGNVDHAADAAWGMTSWCYPWFHITPTGSYLILHMTLEDQHIHHRQLLHKSMPLKLLPYFGPKRGYGHIEGVHCLDFGGLWFWHVSNSVMSRRGTHRRVLTARSHSRYDVITLRLASCQLTAWTDQQWENRLRINARNIHVRVRCARYVGLMTIAPMSRGDVWGGCSKDRCTRSNSQARLTASPT